jgi:hypothetical protein
MNDCPVRFDYYSTNRDRTPNTDRTGKAPVAKMFKDEDGKLRMGHGADKGVKLISADGLAESTRDQMPADQHESSPSLA